MLLMPTCEIANETDECTGSTVYASAARAVEPAARTRTTRPSRRIVVNMLTPLLFGLRRQNVRIGSLVMLCTRVDGVSPRERTPHLHFPLDSRNSDLYSH